MVLLVKDLNKWLRETRIQYAAYGSKRLYVTINTAERFIVTNGESEKRFKKRGEAIRYFNTVAPLDNPDGL